MTDKGAPKQPSQVIAPTVLPETKFEEEKGAYEEEYNDDGLDQDHIVGSSHTVQAAKVALKNSAKTLIKIDGNLYMKSNCIIDVQMLGAALASFEFLKITCICAV